MCVCVCSQSLSCVYFSETYRLQPTRILCPWNFPGKNSGVSSHSLLQGIFPIQGPNPCLLIGRRILYHQHHLGRPMYTYVHLCVSVVFTYPLVNLYSVTTQIILYYFIYLYIEKHCHFVRVITLDFSLLGNSPKASVLCIIKHSPDS